MSFCLNLGRTDILTPLSLPARAAVLVVSLLTWVFELFPDARPSDPAAVSSDLHLSVAPFTSGAIVNETLFSLFLQWLVVSIYRFL